MSRLLVLVLGLGAVAATVLQDTAYRAGQQYVYEYEAHVVSGIPQASKLASGLKVKAKAVLQFQSAKQVVMKLQDVNLYYVNDEVPISVAPGARIPLALCKPLSAEVVQVLMPELIRPIAFSYDRGKIANVKAAPGEMQWALNIKRGIVNILQLNVEGRDALDEVADAQTRMNSHVAGATNRNLFTVLEDGAFGKCKTAYSIKEAILGADGRPAPVMNVTKVIDQKSCQFAPIFVNALTKQCKCAQDADKVKEWLKAETEVNYNLIGHRLGFVIESAKVIGQHAVAPYSQEAGTIVVFTTQELVLASAGPASAAIALPAGARVVVPTVKMAIDEMTAAPAVGAVPAEESDNIAATISINNVNQVMAGVLQGQDEMEVAGKLIRLIKLLQKATPQQLRAVCRDVIEDAQVSSLTAEQAKKRSLLLDVLPALGTDQAANYLKALIVAGKIDPGRIASALTTFGLVAKPKGKTVDMILDICKSPAITGNQVAKQGCWLGWSVLAHEYFKYKVIPSNQAGFKGKCLQEVKGQLAKSQQSGSEADIILFVKVLGNLGFPEVIGELQPIIVDKSKPVIIRSQAIYSVRHAASDKQAKVATVLLPIYLAPNEDTELRVASFIVLMMSKPKPVIMQMIADSLVHESNHHVGSFVYRWAKAYSQSTHPCFTKTAKELKGVLQFAKRFNANILHSQKFHLPAYSDRLQIGGAIDASLITTPGSFLPQHGSIMLNAHALGYSTNVAEISFHTEGIQEILDKIVGPHGSLYKAKSVLDLLKRSRRSVRPADAEIDEIKRKLQFKTLQAPAPRAAIFVKIFTQDVAMLDLDADWLRSVFQTDGRVGIRDIEMELRRGKQINYSKAVLLEQGVYKVPTAVGLPLAVNLSAAAMIDVTGQVKLDVAPKLFAEARPNQVPSIAKVVIAAKPKVSMEMGGSVGVHLPMVKAATIIKTRALASVPISAQIQMDLRTAQHQINIDNIQQEKKLVQLDIAPYTLVRQFKGVSPSAPFELSKKDIVAKAICKQEEKVYAGASEAVGAEIQAKWFRTRCVSSDAPSCPMSGKQSLTIIARPFGSARPEKHQVQIAYKYSNAKASSSPSSAGGAASGPGGSPGSSSVTGTLFSWLYGSDTSSPAQSGAAPDVAEIPMSPLMSVSDPIVQKVIVGVKGIRAGGAASPIVKAQVSYVTDQAGLVRNIDVQAIQDPAPTAQQQKQVCVNGFVKLPDVPEFYDAPLAANIAKVDGELNVKWGEGRQCNVANAIKIKVQGSKSPIQKAFEQGQLYRQLRDYTACQAAKQAGAARFNINCQKIMKKLAEIHQYTAEITYNPQQIATPVKQWSSRMYSAIQAIPAVWQRITDVPAQGAAGKIVANLTLIRNPGSLADVTVQLPTVKQIISALPVPESIKPIRLTKQPMWEEYMHAVSEWEIPAFCELLGGKVVTFDEVIVGPVPIPGCDVILAKDISAGERFLIAVSAQPNTNKKVWKIYVEGKKIEISGEAPAYTVKIDGAVRQIAKQRPIVVRADDTQANAPILIKIEILSDNVIKVAAPLSKIAAIADGNNIKLEASPFYFNKTIGLCGNFDAEKTNEWRGPQGQIYTDPGKLAISYMVPGQNCNAQQLYQQFSYVAPAARECRQSEQHDKFEREANGERQVCVSTIPVKVCTPGCRITKAPLRIGYHCMPVHHVSTQLLLEEMESHVVPRLRTQPAHVWRMKDVPRQCTPTF